MSQAADPPVGSDPDRDPDRELAAFLARHPDCREEDFEAFVREHPDLEAELRSRFTRLQAVAPTLASLMGHEHVGTMIAQLFGRRAEPCQQSMPVDVAGSEGEGSTEELLQRLGQRSDPWRRYRRDGDLDEGGMGVIVKIWDADLRRHVVMKVLKQSGRNGSSAEHAPATSASAAGTQAPLAAASDEERRRRLVARFLDEALVTAQLDHPGIVPVHEVGRDDEGRLFFTMKLVKGENFSQVIDRVRQGQQGWTLNRAVGVLRRVCEAVAYAHSKGVLHRDIKPANIMVGRFGESYLMDWGLARVLGDEPLDAPPAETVGSDPAWSDESGRPDSWLYTRDHTVMGTPPYMAPEQALGRLDQVDERSDVYSLGSILYHLLTGRVPYVEPDELPLPLVVLLRVRHGPPAPVSELAPDAPPTLRSLCERAMARRIEERFPSADELGAALADYLEDISEDREEARRQAERAQLINDFLLDMLASADPAQARGREVSVRDVLDRAAARVDRALPGHPLHEAALRSTIGKLYLELGRYAEAEPQLVRALDLRAAHLAEEHADVLGATTDLALLRQLQGRHGEAQRLLERTAEVQRRALGDDHAATLRTLDILASVRRAAGTLEEAAELYGEVLRGRRQLLGEGHRETLATLRSLGWVLRDLGRLAEAEPLVRATCEGMLEREGESHPETLIAMSDLAGLLQARGRLEEAEALYRRTLLVQRQVLGEEHPNTLVALNNLGWVLRLRGDLAGAEAAIGSALSGMAERGDGEPHPMLLAAMHNLALVHLEQGRDEAALELLRRAVEQAETRLGADHCATARYRFGLARCLLRRGDGAECAEQLRRAHDALERTLGPQHAWTREAAEELARLQ